VVPISTRIGGFWFWLRLRQCGADYRNDGGTTDPEAMQQRAPTDDPARGNVRISQGLACHEMDLLSNR
jgi:hypothetical protein